MIVESPEALRVWLTKEMAPICDAEPAALAKYVLALLRKDKPEAELMEFCIEQLDVFLQTKARPFVEKLFGVIKDRSYIMPSAQSSATAASASANTSNQPTSQHQSTQPNQVSPNNNSSTSRGSSSDNRKKEVDEKKESTKDKDIKDDDKKKASSASERDRDMRRGRDDKESSDKKGGAQQQSDIIPNQPQKSVRKRISPPIANPRDDQRRDHPDLRFERRRSRSPRDRGRGVDRSDRLDRGSDRGERVERGLDRGDRGSERGDRIDRGFERGDRGFERGQERGDRVLERSRLQAVNQPRAVHRQNERYKGGDRLSDRVERIDRTERKRSRSPYERPRREKSAEVEQRKKKRCRDYDEKGYCMKGDQCIYDHGPDPLVVDDIALEKMVSTGGSATNAANNNSSTTKTTLNTVTNTTASLPPQQITPNFSVPPPGYTPLNPPPPGVDNVYMANSSAATAIPPLSEGYNPEAPALSAASSLVVQGRVQAPDFSIPPPPIPLSAQPPPALSQSHLGGQAAPQSWPSSTYPAMHHTNPQSISASSASILVHPTANSSTSYDPSQPSTNLHNVVQQTLSSGAVVTRQLRGANQMMGANINVNRYGISSSSTNPSNNRTLQVRKIPIALNNITKLNEHFANFGQIVNIQVCYDGDPEAALITYSTRGEAMSAYKSTTPILNNRFIKVFWHAPDSQQANSAQQFSHAPGVMSGSAVSYNPVKGSLTKTVHIGGSRSQKATATNKQTPNAVDASDPTAAQNQLKSKTNLPVPQSIADKEKYIEVRRKRKQEKENKMRLLDLHRRKSALLTKEIEQQKLIIKALQNATNADKKKQLCGLFKKVDESVKSLKGELEELSMKLMEMNKNSSESNGQTAEADDMSKAEKTVADDQVTPQNGSTAKTVTSKRSRSVSDASADGHQTEATTVVSAPLKKIRHVDSTQAIDNRSRVVAVRGFTAESENDLIVHMEHFGELVDMDFTAGSRNKAVTAYFTYRTRHDAEQAVALGADFGLCPIVVEWATKNGSTEVSGVVPDEKRNPSERVTPAALLASCPLDEVHF
ncbi:unnamed protein product [Anisakis simplex]|uniref:Putative rrm/rnp domain (inferred by orthology to a S. mansoni protein) n=1 Tax=Anisakis simplex TaxID=6269 RepID=A0A158PP32_ANISI|nr:unnamed protein product [Anisakis simplex]